MKWESGVGEGRDRKVSGYVLRKSLGVFKDRGVLEYF